MCVAKDQRSRGCPDTAVSAQKCFMLRGDQGFAMTSRKEGKDMRNRCLSRIPLA